MKIWYAYTIVLSGKYNSECDEKIVYSNSEEQNVLEFESYGSDIMRHA